MKAQASNAMIHLFLTLPITTFPEKVCQPLEIHPIHLVEAINFCAVYIENCNDLPFDYNGHYNFAPAVTVASNVPWELVHIRDQLCLPCLGSNPTDSPAEQDGLASDFPLERPKYQLPPSRLFRVKDVEA